MLWAVMFRDHREQGATPAAASAPQQDCVLHGEALWILSCSTVISSYRCLLTHTCNVSQPWLKVRCVNMCATKNKNAIFSLWPEKETIVNDVTKSHSEMAQSSEKFYLIIIFFAEKLGARTPWGRKINVRCQEMCFLYLCLHFFPLKSGEIHLLSLPEKKLHLLRLQSSVQS